MTLVYCDCADCEHIDPAEGACDRVGITIGAHASCLNAKRTGKGVKDHEKTTD